MRALSKRVTEILLRDPKHGRLLYKPNKSGETPYLLDASHPKSILTEIFGASKVQLLTYIIMLFCSFCSDNLVNCNNKRNELKNVTTMTICFK